MGYGSELLPLIMMVCKLPSAAHTYRMKNIANYKLESLTFRGMKTQLARQSDSKLPFSLASTTCHRFIADFEQNYLSVSEIHYVAYNVSTPMHATRCHRRVLALDLGHQQ
jgi:hypothetical protein